MHLIRLLADLYAAGARLTLLETNGETGEYPSQEMPKDFQNLVMERYGQYLKNQDGNPFEDIAIACEFLDSVLEL